MYKIYSFKNDSIYIEIDSLKKYIKNYIQNNSYNFKKISIELFINKGKENNEFFIFINEKITNEIVDKINSLRRDVLFFLNTELGIDDFYVNIVAR